MRRILTASDRALLVEEDDLAAALRLVRALSAAPPPGLLELVPAARTILVRFNPVATSARKLSETIRRVEAVEGELAAAREHVIPVRYDGEDLAVAAELLGLDAAELVRRHQAARWSVAFTGFAPGFGYLIGDDPVFDVPRRSSPRTRIPAGSVGLAGRFSGIYPRESPGGWQLIGRTDVPMWDLDREPPALLAPGDVVRFVAASTADATRAERGRESGSTVLAAASAPPRHAIEVVASGVQLLLQDAGRPGLAAFGVSASGVADRRAFRDANRAVGNPEETAVLEHAGGGAVLRFRGPAVIAVAGADAECVLGDADGTTRAIALGAPVAIDDGDELRIGRLVRGLRVVIAVRGGVAVPPVLASRSTDTLAGLGPRPLAAGDLLPLEGPSAAKRSVESSPDAPPRRLPAPDETTELRILLGPRDDWFTPAAIASLESQAWAVTAHSDRVGVRLDGECPLERVRGGELESEGVVVGAIQVPPSGQPVLFLADHPLTGGYPVIGSVIDEDLDIAAQLPPGASVRFRVVGPGPRPAAASGVAREPAAAARSDAGDAGLAASASRHPNAPIRRAGARMNTVLIANRGEIAVRVIRACREAGLRAVAVYADQDVDAMHVRLADEACALHGSTPAETYLDIDSLLDAARRSGADALHPGYGFLSESAEFARAVEAAGLIWIGPDPESIELLGDKIRARAIARATGAPLAPGTEAPIGDVGEAIAFAQQHGLPVIVKAAFGGGGRGLRIARTIEEVPDAFEAASREAELAFGRGECFIERFLEHPRHLEVQVLGDGEGQVVVVGDRDCSLQRRGQKLVEEAPAPGLSDDERELIHRSARDLCAAVRYRGAGTVEFLRGVDGTISFLEVNTRLQVEHPVTELVADVDLVREQLRIAAGEGLSLSRTPSPRGHAIEFRINAEDPGRGFLPAPGRIQALRVPAGPGIRWDAGVEAGDRVEAAFDSLAAKLVIHAGDRPSALARARRALAELEIDGIPTVIPFARAVVDEAAFAELPLGVSTQWIESELMPRLAPESRAVDAGESPLRRIAMEIDGRRVLVGLPDSLLGALAAGRSSAAAQQLGGDGATPDETVLASPMPAALVRWLVDDDVDVEEGQELAVISAMKMESRVASHRSGRLEQLAEPGSQLAAGDGIARIR